MEELQGWKLCFAEYLMEQTADLCNVNLVKSLMAVKS